MRGTLIDTPEGQTPVEEIKEGMVVWTVNTVGERISAAVIKTATTPLPLIFGARKITLSDGRSLTASPGHPSADSRPLGSYQVGEILDGASITSVEDVVYTGVTFDLLPAGATGEYWANGILVKSTINIR